MYATIIEQHVIGKRPDQDTCEDVLVTGEHFIGVIDGCTDKSGVHYDAMTSGRFAALSLARTFAELSPTASIRDGVDLLSANLARDIARVNPDPPADLPTASVVVLSVARQEIWRVGDCSYALDADQHVGWKLIDQVTGEARSALLECLGLENGDGAGCEFIQPLLNLQYRLLNRDDDSRFSYGAINSRHVPDRFLEVTPVPAQTHHVVLHTDGYPTTEVDLATSEAHLVERLERDPFMLEAPGSQKGLVPGNLSYDDRAYLRVLLDW